VAGGTISPGGGINGAAGTLTATNAISLGGNTVMKLNYPGSDTLVSSTAGHISFGGVLTVTNIGGALQANQSFTLFSAPSLTGSFTSTNLPATPNYTVWNTSQLGLNGTITLAPTPPPAISTVNFGNLASGSITVNATNGAHASNNSNNRRNCKPENS